MNCLSSEVLRFWTHSPQSICDMKSPPSFVRCTNAYLSSDVLNVLTLVSVSYSTSEIIETLDV